jgi:superfamily II DNA/RNA helicase
LEQYPAPAKVIIYSSSIETIKALGERLGYPMYFADVGSEKQKAYIQQQWENASQRVMICSNAFGLGIDQPDVRVVGHVGPIHDIENYGQESGRAGRDGQASEVDRGHYNSSMNGSGESPARAKPSSPTKIEHGSSGRKPSNLSVGFHAVEFGWTRSWTDEPTEGDARKESRCVTCVARRTR